jgi:hypothetical protein
VLLCASAFHSEGDLLIANICATRQIAQRAIAAGKDELGVQAQRLQMIAGALK